MAKKVDISYEVHSWNESISRWYFVLSYQSRNPCINYARQIFRKGRRARVVRVYHEQGQTKRVIIWEDGEWETGEEAI